METIRNFYQRAFAPTSIASLVYFRVLFGLIMLWEVYRYFSKNWIPKYYIRPEFNFTYWGFEWVKPLPGNGMYIVWGLLGVLSITIALGLFYRLSTVLFFYLFSYVFLLAKSHYLNHFYFVILVSLILIFISPHKAFSLDAKRGAVKEDFLIPCWQLWLLRFQMGVVYFYGGLAKMDVDWIFGVPLNRWLDKHKSVPFIGEFLANDLSALGLSWMGLLLDLFIVPALLYKKTRKWGYLALAIFHVSNHFLFKIGIFPWFSLGITLLFFASDFPLKVLEKLNNIKIGWPLPKTPALKALSQNQKLTAATVTLFVLYNCLMPLRHHLYKGDVHWNEVGHPYSWRMKLRSKSPRVAVFYFKDNKTGKKWQEKANKRLKRKQWRSLGGHPSMVVQYAQYLKEVYRKEGYDDLRIRAKVIASVNYRKKQRLIVKRYDLSKAKDCLFCNPEWIEPLTKENQRSFSDSLQKFNERTQEPKI